MQQVALMLLIQDYAWPFQALSIFGPNKMFISPLFSLGMLIGQVQRESKNYLNCNVSGNICMCMFYVKHKI